MASQNIRKAKKPEKPSQQTPDITPDLPPSSPKLHLFLRRIVLRNLRCFQEFSLDLAQENQSVDWITLLGNNAQGKNVLNQKTNNISLEQLDLETKLRVKKIFLNLGIENF